MSESVTEALTQANFTAEPENFENLSIFDDW